MNACEDSIAIGRQEDISFIFHERHGDRVIHKSTKDTAITVDVSMVLYVQESNSLTIQKTELVQQQAIITRQKINQSRDTRLPDYQTSYRGYKKVLPPETK